MNLKLSAPEVNSGFFFEKPLLIQTNIMVQALREL